MFAVSFYDFMATEYSEKIGEKCSCHSFLKCKIDKNSERKLKSITCPKCWDVFPETSKYIAQKINDFIKEISIK